ncbi:DUF1566 domain-containing protein [Duganella sp. LjRoot269]|uniref:DUF1566 domain-containing protein n=1 Tax=Duganella sp. LjRoot269 TaxID=3342305 RepID=UPI003ECD0671
MDQKLSTIPAAIGAAFEGGLYAGIARGVNGLPDTHIVLLPAAAEDVTWDQAKAFAAEAGGELPTRSEQALLYANLKDQFEEDWYWSGEQHASTPSLAWYQYFYGGSQYYGRKSYGGRARAVRRLPI